MTFPLDGWDLIPIPHLRRPRLEKERGSGYVNLSAVERNRKALADARKMFIMKGERKIFVPGWCFDETVAALRKAIPPVQVAL